MPKRRLSLRVRIPPYQAPRNQWRRLLNSEVRKRQVRRGIHYSASDRLEVQVLLYMDAVSLRFHDVDNRLKDILDALQGRAGGSKGVRSMPAIIPNDSQIYRVTVEKRTPPPQSRGWGHLIIRSFQRKRTDG